DAKLLAQRWSWSTPSTAIPSAGRQTPWPDTWCPQNGTPAVVHVVDLHPIRPDSRSSDPTRGAGATPLVVHVIALHPYGRPAGRVIRRQAPAKLAAGATPRTRPNRSLKPTRLSFGVRPIEHKSRSCRVDSVACSLDHAVDRLPFVRRTGRWPNPKCRRNAAHGSCHQPLSI